MKPRTPSQRLAAVLNVEVDFGSDLGSLCSLYPLDRDQSGKRHEQQRVSKTTEHNFCRSSLKRAVDLRFGGFGIVSCVVAGSGFLW